jgi:excisionase family DNA binding protein
MTIRSNASYPPRGLRAEAAAEYLGMSRSKFLQLVDKGRLPRPKAIDGMSIWDRHELDAAFESFAATRVDGGRTNSFDQVLGA